MKTRATRIPHMSCVRACVRVPLFIYLLLQTVRSGDCRSGDCRSVGIDTLRVATYLTIFCCFCFVVIAGSVLSSSSSSSRTLSAAAFKQTTWNNNNKNIRDKPHMFLLLLSSTHSFTFPFFYCFFSSVLYFISGFV